MQLRFSPLKQRRKQLDSTEKLLAAVDKEKEYPFEFVCFMITGFRPRGPVAQHLIKGNELAEDLRIFIARLSSILALHADEQNQKVYTVEELAKNFGVSTKTINRWREQGLLARKFIFKGGKKRLGFLQSAVDKFARANPHLAPKAKTFTRLTKNQKRMIIKQAAALAAKGKVSSYQIIKQIAAGIGRARETIRYTILNYERANPDKPVFGKLPGAISPTDAAELYRLFQQGTGIKELMKRFSRSKSSIYRIINRRRVKALLTKKIEFVASNEFLEENAREKILAKPIDFEKLVPAGRSSSFELSGASLPQYLQNLKDTPVLNRKLEAELFRMYNYLKYLASTARTDLRIDNAPGARVNEIENYLAQADAIKKIIISANLRLVVSIANKHTGSGAELVDLVSEGNFSLMRTVEKFDYTRGFRFATYAAWAIAKNYARKIPAEAARADKTESAPLADVQRDLRITEAVDFAAIERARQSLIQVIKNELDEREQYIILNHFGLVGPPVKKQRKTLKQIGDELGLTKERVRQIELTALQKLRQSLSIEEFELLTH